MKNEALRLFLAVTAIIITALLSSPMLEMSDSSPESAQVRNTASEAKTETKTEKPLKKKSHSTRSYAFFFRR